ncbi:MAG TPA: DUF4112 domain-containing protein [Bdellovibrionota bacterium]|jgi:hypothetical protein|nr:DUF4112 domain-containing protein [Bdellovibrionota bacterium]
MITTPHARLQHLRTLARLLDSQFRGPLGSRFGFDGLLGLIPFVGDAVTTGVSFYIVIQAYLLGCTPATLLRMALNIALDNLIASVPVLGNVFDFFWKSNDKNIGIIDAHLRDAPATARRSSLVIVSMVLLSLAIIGLGAWITYLGLAWAWSLLQSLGGATSASF